MFRTQKYTHLNHAIVKITRKTVSFYSNIRYVLVAAINQFKCVYKYTSIIIYVRDLIVLNVNVANRTKSSSDEPDSNCIRTSVMST
ncbi:MAG: hypothetical protein H8D96_12195 [Desulfobacterales bacterium]|uniref:Uncharacterized protein n=1 Tax=Candidatus Desulfatibia vada TaxID=2841696 RepID=A0A8J6TKZ1_9BACT|nr:hypothetical protein [Candidatus Desulfatibia vada]